MFTDLSFLNGHPPTVSVCLATYKRPLGFLRLLDSLKEQKHTDFSHLEVIAVNDGSHEEGYQDDYDEYPFKVVYLPRGRRPDDRPSVYACRNIAVANAVHEVIWILDDDIVVDDHSLAFVRLWHHLRPFDGIVLRAHEANPTDPVHFQAPFPIHTQDWDLDRVLVYLTTAGLSIRKAHWEAVGGLDEEYDGAMGFADLDLGIRLWKAGYNVIQADCMSVWVDDVGTGDDFKGSHRDRYIHWGDQQHRNGHLLMKKLPDDYHHFIS